MDNFLIDYNEIPLISNCIGITSTFEEIHKCLFPNIPLDQLKCVFCCDHVNKDTVKNGDECHIDHYTVESNHDRFAQVHYNLPKYYNKYKITPYDYYSDEYIIALYEFNEYYSIRLDLDEIQKFQKEMKEKGITGSIVSANIRLFNHVCDCYF